MTFPVDLPDHRRNHQTARAEEREETPMSRPVVTVYTSGPSCMQCRMTKRHLEGRGIPFSEVAIDSDDNILAAITELGFTTAPVVCASTWKGEESWDGYRPDRIDALLEEAS